MRFLANTIVVSLYCLQQCSASPIDNNIGPHESLFLRPRDHLVCDNDGWNCHMQATCANDFSATPGQAEKRAAIPSSSPAAASAPNIPTPNNIGKPNATLNGDGSVSTHGTRNGRELVSRQGSPVEWCALGTPFFVRVNPTSSKSSNDIKSLINFAIAQIKEQLPGSANKVINSTSSPILQYSVSSGDLFNVWQLPGQQWTWGELAAATNLTQQWMAQSAGYLQVAVQATNGSTDLGRIQII